MLLVQGNRLIFNEKTYRCAVGKGGFSAEKREGDHKTPLGVFPLRECWYRADRIDPPVTQLPLRVISESDGWCDDPRSGEYNRHILIPPACGAQNLAPLAGGGRRGVSLHNGDFEGNGHPHPDPLPQAGEGGMAQGVGRTAFTTRDSDSIRTAKTLRKNQTDMERKLWRVLRQSQLENYKFRRQQPIGNYIVDFVCMDKKLIIELDGGQHSEDRQRQYDEQRTAYLEAGGYRVLRFWNHDVFENMEGVVKTILRELDPALMDTPHLTSPRKRGGGFERLFRDDHVYDLVIPIGYNDDPPVPGKGSAIFLHLAHDDYRGTEGCIALSKPDLLAILPHLSSATHLHITE